MKLLSLFLLTLPAQAFAISHYDAPASSCSSLQRAINQEGEAILYTGEYTYFRAVAHGGYCMMGERPTAKYTKTKDVPRCFVGLECKEGK